MKIKLKIQSFSDIITNSSSELFCTVKGRNIGVEFLAKILDHYAIWESDSDENTFLINLERDCFVDEVPQKWLQKGIIAILDEKLGKENYEIIFDTDSEF